MKWWVVRQPDVDVTIAVTTRGVEMVVEQARTPAWPTPFLPRLSPSRGRDRKHETANN